MDAGDRERRQPRGDDAASESPPQAVHDPETGILVLAAVIRRAGRYLVARRTAHKRHGGLWEFPGGKLLPGESWLDAARRELAEELAVTAVAAGEPLLRVRDPGSSFVVVFVRVEIIGDPQLLEHSAVRWVAREELAHLDLAPADRVLVEALGAGSIRD
jgi:mutator protein MutT